MKVKEYSGLKLFLVIVVVNGLLAFSNNYLFINDDLFYQTYGEQLAISRIDKMLDLRDRWEWLGYAFLPLLLLFRVFLTSSCLCIGIYFADLKLSFSKLFKIALLTDFIYVLSGFVKLVILIFFKPISTLYDLQFTPFSPLLLVINIPWRNP